MIHCSRSCSCNSSTIGRTAGRYLAVVQSFLPCRYTHSKLATYLTYLHVMHSHYGVLSRRMINLGSDSLLAGPRRAYRRLLRQDLGQISLPSNSKRDQKDLFFRIHSIRLRLSSPAKTLLRGENWSRGARRTIKVFQIHQYTLHAGKEAHWNTFA